jgi:hypothetical protein
MMVDLESSAFSKALKESLYQAMVLGLAPFKYRRPLINSEVTGSTSFCCLLAVSTLIQGA